MTTRRTVLATAGSLVVAGCVTGDDDPASPTESPTDGSTSPTDTSPTETPPTGTETAVTYVLRSGQVPDAFAAATATVQPVVVEDERDLGPCYPEVYEGPYKPTITPIPTPRGACHPGDPVEVDLVATDETTIDMTVPPTARGHALFAIRVVGTDRDGDAITAIKGTGGVILLEESSPPGDTYGVEMGIDPGPEEADYEYWVTTERVEAES